MSEACLAQEMPSHLSPCVTASTWEVGAVSARTLPALNCDIPYRVDTVVLAI